MMYQSQASIDHLRTRAELLRSARSFFDERRFLEVQTPVLSRSTVIDRHLDPIELEMQLPGLGLATWYLQTSPEQSMKRLLASGIGSIYQIGPVFRSAELGEWHNPEFTMAEWYDVGAGFEQGLTLLDELLQTLLGCDAAERVQFQQVFQIATGLDLFRTDSDALAKWCVDHGLVHDIRWTTDWDTWVNLIFSERVQPQLGPQRPVLVTHFPASQAALAKVSEDDPRTAERFEAFYRGVELANGYHELLDADQLHQRSIEANQQRVGDGKRALPLQNHLIDAMRNGLPASCGCALGFDRVVMLACKATQLADVIAFDAFRA
jgi:lysyl-tRNA synthetase class 2